MSSTTPVEPNTVQAITKYLDDKIGQGVEIATGTNYYTDVRTNSIKFQIAIKNGRMLALSSLVNFREVE